MKQNDEVRDMLKIHGEINDAKIEGVSYKVDTHVKTIKSDTKWMARHHFFLEWKIQTSGHILKNKIMKVTVLETWCEVIDFICSTPKVFLNSLKNTRGRIFSSKVEAYLGLW